MDELGLRDGLGLGYGQAVGIVHWTGGTQALFDIGVV